MMTIRLLAGFLGLSFLLITGSITHAAVNAETPILDQVDLSQYIYSYGTVLKISEQEMTLQEYDYDSDVEKEVTYRIIADTKLEGLKSLAELSVEDVVEVYYNEENGQRVAKIIHREMIEDEPAVNDVES